VRDGAGPPGAWPSAAPALRWLLPAVSGAVLLVDQVTKGLALSRGSVYFNPGIAFGLLADHALVSLFLAGAGIAVVAMAAVRSAASPVTLVGMGLIIGGGLGNLVDRVPVDRRPGVVDWITLPRYGPHFNLADVAIRVGLLVVLAGIAVRARGPGRLPVQSSAGA
jgi:signal peptidase II